MNDTSKTIDTLLTGFVLGIAFGLTVMMAIMSQYPPKKALKLYSLEHGIGHYDQKTGNYIQDSLFKLDDSTIRIKRRITND